MLFLSQTHTHQGNDHKSQAIDEIIQRAQLLVNLTHSELASRSKFVIGRGQLQF